MGCGWIMIKSPCERTLGKMQIKPSCKQMYQRKRKGIYNYRLHGELIQKLLFISQEN